MKKGQTSIFVIIALIIVIGAISFFVFQNTNDEAIFEGLMFSQKVDVVKKATEDCLTIIYQDSLDFVGAQGGYYREPLNYYVAGDDFYLPIYSFNGENTVPSKEFIEQELSFAVGDNLDFCLDSIQERYSTINLEYGDYSTEVNILEETVKFDTIIDVSLSSKDGIDTAQIEVEKKEIPSKINDMILVADYYISSKIVDPETICIDCITELAEKFGLIIEVTNYDQDIIVVDIFSDDSETYPALFNFLEVYIADGGELSFPILESKDQIQRNILDEKEITEEEYNAAIKQQEDSLPAPTT
jgi:hypothetical protein|tara:strand:- start:161 stop:1060 length:900 start_codon:yes stop_codon:yes gene_type:complete